MSEYDEAVSYDDGDDKPTPICEHRLPRGYLWCVRPEEHEN